MTLRKGYKYRLKLRPRIQSHFARNAGACRFIWNHILALNERRYLAGVPRLNYYDAWARIAWMKQSEEYGWLKAANAESLQQCLIDLEKAYKNLFAGRAAPPTYRKKFLADSFRYPQGCKVAGNQVYLPKIGWVRFFKSRDWEGTVKNVTVSRHGKHWYVALQTEQDLPAPVHPAPDHAVGIDLGLATFAALSDGTVHPPLNALRRCATKKARLQRCLALKVKHSQNWKKLQRRLAQLDCRIAHCRQDFLHQLATRITKNHGIICVEDLQVRNMTRSARGTVEHPGTQVAQKAGLNKAILDQGWGMFRRMLEYKQTWMGGEVIAVNPRYTSQECPECHHVSALNRPQQALFSCTRCGYSYHADVVAARNILARGLRERLNACATPLVSAGILDL
jgi:putative transposase